MNIQNHSSGVAKAGLATGIVGSTLGALNMVGNGSGLLNGLTRGVAQTVVMRIIL